MKIESSTLIHAQPATVYALYADVPNWPTWDPDCKSATINGPFASGAMGVIVPNGGPKSPMRFENVVHNKGFNVICKLPLCEMRFEHELEDSGNDTKAIHRVVFEGVLAPLFGLLIGSGMKKSQPKALASLKSVAEKA